MVKAAVLSSKESMPFYSRVGRRRKKSRREKCQNKEGLDLCLEDNLVKGLGFVIDQEKLQ